MTNSGKVAASRADLVALLARVFMAANTSAANAVLVARALVAAEFDGQGGHGLSRVKSYAAQATSGKVNGHAEPRIVPTTPDRPGTVRIDAAHGFAYPALDLATKHMTGTLLKSAGVCAAGIVRSHHAGVVGHHVEAIAEQGYVALMFANTPHAMAPWGGKASLFGTNPIGFACPRRDGIAPIVIDMALSGVARGKILAASQKGEPIPLGWAVDKSGQPTTDAKAALEGTLLPAGGAKGSALALMVEILATALIGANFSKDSASFFDGAGKPPGVGQFLIAIDPKAFGDAGAFLDRIETLVAAFATDGARLPGQRRLTARTAEALSIDASLLAEFEAMAAPH